MVYKRKLWNMEDIFFSKFHLFFYLWELIFNNLKINFFCIHLPNLLLIFKICFLFKNPVYKEHTIVFLVYKKRLTLYVKKILNVEMNRKRVAVMTPLMMKAYRKTLAMRRGIGPNTLLQRLGRPLNN